MLPPQDGVDCGIPAIKRLFYAPQTLLVRGLSVWRSFSSYPERGCTAYPGRAETVGKLNKPTVTLVREILIQKNIFIDGFRRNAL